MDELMVQRGVGEGVDLTLVDGVPRADSLFATDLFGPGGERSLDLTRHVRSSRGSPIT